jgi:hypothetical protein
MRGAEAARKAEIGVVVCAALLAAVYLVVTAGQRPSRVPVPRAVPAWRGAVPAVPVLGLLRPPGAGVRLTSRYSGEHVVLNPQTGLVVWSGPSAPRGRLGEVSPASGKVAWPDPCPGGVFPGLCVSRPGRARPARR